MAPPPPPQQPTGAAGGRQGGELPTASVAHAGSALKFKGACLPANKARRGLGPRDQLRSPQKGRGPWRQMDIPHAGRGTSDLLPHSRLQRLFARRASSLGAAVRRTLPAGRGWPSREGALGNSQGQVATPATTPIPGASEEFPGARARWWPGAGRAGETKGACGPGGCCAHSPAPHPARSRALPCAQVARPSAPREGVSQRGRTKTHFRGVWGPDPGPAAHSRS